MRRVTSKPALAPVAQDAEKKTFPIVAFGTAIAAAVATYFVYRRRNHNPTASATRPTATFLHGLHAIVEWNGAVGNED